MLSKIDVNEAGCWNWVGASRMSNGYGAVWHNGKVQGAHRVAFELWLGVIPDGMHICHHCDNRICVNPDHLFAGTNLDNRRDAVRKGRHKTPISLRGYSHPSAKLTPMLVLQIRASNKGCRFWASALGVSKTTITKVKRMETYAEMD